MLSLHPARHRRTRTSTRAPKIGLAIAGGGPIGAMYELGALRALDEALDGLDLTRLDSYVGISSGAFLAAGLANRLDVEEMCRAFITGDSDDLAFRAEDFLRPAFGEYARRIGGLPRLALDWSRALLPGATRPALFGGAVPTGVFDNRGVERFLADVFSRRGRSNDFRALEAALHVVAVDLDSGEATVFGSEDHAKVPISRAVQASAALPGLYPPVRIDGRDYVDGALRRTMHASVVLERDIDLMLGLNPLVPYSDRPDGAAPRRRRSRPLADGGLPAVLSQTFRTLLQSRMQVGLAKYAQQYPDVDQLVFEPGEGASELFFLNAFSFSTRHRVCALGYRQTLDDLHAREAELAPVLGAHGIRLRPDIVADLERTLLDGLPPRRTRRTETTARLHRALDDVERLIDTPPR
ncbi:Lectin subunit beta [Luteimonas sp. 9C]|uniref:patatin-like phospholipase family protein n=1 Tax=Luteimonas sp. 9C TaxID=2653148 RepID=UPI0012F14902|nr:patatin-like phospholipase family protein [Luteimonas sp. 9C]VXB31223.1 Lectin subunit beta [Luteimonas sp. 9C]